MSMPPTDRARARLAALKQAVAKMTPGSWVSACIQGFLLENYDTSSKELSGADASGLLELRNHAAALIEIAEAAIESYPSHRAAGCWCGVGHDIEGFGHEPKCARMCAAIAKLGEGK